MVGERRLHQKRERRSQWNAVLVDGEWRLLDVLWASCSLVRRRVAGWSLIDVDGERFTEEQEDEAPGEKSYEANEFFFLTDPDRFICTHLPDDPRWQLLPRPLSVVQFESFVYVRERFFDLELMMLPDSQRRCVLKTTDAEVTISFGIPASIGSSVQFRYMLFRDHDGDGNEDKSMTQSKGCVIYQQSDNRISYTCRIFEVGRYRMDIYGRHTDHHGCMDLICGYVIECESTNGRQLPDDPEIGWGPGSALEEVGLVAVTHLNGVIYTDHTGVTIRLLKSTDTDLVFWHCLKHNTFDEAKLVSRAVLRMSGDDVIIQLRLPVPGEYAYMLFAEILASSGDLANVCNYLIKFDEPIAPTTPFPPLRWGVLGAGVNARTLGFKMDRKGKEGYIETSTADVHLKVKVPVSRSIMYYEVGCSHDVSGRSPAVVNLKVSRQQVDIRVNLTESGEYALNMFVRRQSDKTRLHHVHTILINYTDQSELHCENETSIAETDLSANEQSENTRESVCTHEWCETIESEYKVVLPQSEHELLVAAERKAAQYPVDFIRVKRNETGSRERVVSLPLEGDYVVDVFEVREDSRLENVRRIHVKRTNKVTSNIIVCYYCI